MKRGVVSIYADKDLKSFTKNIKCPLHHVLKPGLPGHYAYKIEPNPMAKNFSNDMCKQFGLRKWKYKRDRFGNKIPDFKNHFQPEISAAYARDRIYDSLNPNCRKCRRCIQ